MAYRDHFRHADDVASHLGVMPEEPSLQAKYVGFMSVAAVTVYELAIREIFIEFARRKHAVFGHFTKRYFDRVNGRIRIEDIRDRYIGKFGAEYQLRFGEKLKECSDQHLEEKGLDIRKAYQNVITWRNQFAHEGQIRYTATYNEVIAAYKAGKEVIHCLDESMT